MTSDIDIQVFGISKESFVDGPGIRYAIFLQGCPHHCHGCHNPDSQLIGPDFGRKTSLTEIIKDIESNSLLSGITLTGGEPFIHVETCKQIIDSVKDIRPNFDIWIWSGFTYEQIVSNDAMKSLLDKCDVLVDGLFVKNQLSLNCKWRGSINQKIIDLNETRKNQRVIYHVDN